MSVDLARLREINAELTEAHARAEVLRRDRAEVVGRLLESGFTLRDIASVIGVSHQRVHQWAQS
jgi:transposase-like protein